jgi:hypothetical protein
MGAMKPRGLWMIFGICLITTLAFTGCTTDDEAERSGWRDVTPYEARSIAGRYDPSPEQEDSSLPPNTFTF